MDIPPTGPGGRQWQDTDMITIKILNKILDAQANCGNAALDYGDANRAVAQKNYTIAKESQPDGFFARLWLGSKSFVAGFLTGLIFGLAH